MHYQVNSEGLDIISCAREWDPKRSSFVVNCHNCLGLARDPSSSREQDDLPDGFPFQSTKFRIKGLCSPHLLPLLRLLPLARLIPVLLHKSPQLQGSNICGESNSNHRLSPMPRPLP
jgi:hypothetical protein